jgi:hypothetical protein
MEFDSTRCGGGHLLKKYKLGAAVANAGIPIIMVATTCNVGPCTSTSFADTVGLSADTDTYSTSQAAILARVNALVGTGEGIITVSVRPDNIIRALMTGSGTENTTLAILTNTSASAGGTVVTATVQSSDIDGGTLWCLSGNNVGYSRTITTHTSTTSLTVTVPFPRAIAVGDTFLACPWNNTGTASAGEDGITEVTTSTLFTQADASSASGAGGKVVVSDLVLEGPYNSYVKFQFDDQIFKSTTV